jgi:tRNA(Ile)-lysidine synthase
MDLHSLECVCDQDCGLTRNRPVVAGVSGGADSLALADCMAALGYSVLVAHFDHHLRPESRSDLEFVRDFAAQKGFLFEAGNGDVTAFARENGLSIEEAARQMRYEFLFEIARKHEVQALVVGHTADDQVETVLMHLLRGAGLDGLKGMPWRGILEVFDPEIPLVRPLLGVWRADTETWCREHALEYRVDVTNQDTTYARNMLRKEIIPLLDRYNPQARTHIHRMALHLGGDQRVLMHLAEEALKESLEASGEGYLILKREYFSQLDPALQARVIRLGVVRLVRVLRDFDAGAVERCLKAAVQATSGWQGDLPGGLRLRVEKTQLYLMTWGADLPGQDWPQVAEDVLLQVTCPGEISLGNGWLLKAEPVDQPGSALATALENDDPDQVWLELGERTESLVVKRAPPGQRFIPLGMDVGSQKLSDFWVNVRLPKAARAGWPVVFLGGEPAWLPGFRLAQPFRLTENSRRVIHLNLLRTKDNSDG